MGQGQRQEAQEEAEREGLGEHTGRGGKADEEPAASGSNKAQEEDHCSRKSEVISICKGALEECKGCWQAGVVRSGGDTQPRMDANGREFGKKPVKGELLSASPKHEQSN